MPVHLCPCGAPAPETMPQPGGDPVLCAVCSTPLVRPGSVRASALERGAGAAALAAVLAAGAWVGASWLTRDGAPWAAPFVGVAAGAAARWIGGARGRAMQWIAALATLAGVVVAEALLYRHTTYVRLLALHEAEGRPDAQFLAEEEFRRMDPWRYVHIEATPLLFFGIAAALWVAWRIAALPPAVVAFEPRSESAPPKA